MDPKKPAGPRRVWRMTSENPLGEVLELVPKTSEPWRSSSSGSRQAEGTRAPDARPSTAVRPVADAGAPARVGTGAAGPMPIESRPVAPPAESPAKVLTPARVASWRSSSFDLLNGLIVNDVTETIPGDVFDEIFRATPTAVRRPSTKPR